MNYPMHEEQKNLSPIKSIRSYCLDCSNGSAKEVKLCPVEHCPLYQYRFGKNPKRKRKKLTDEQRQQFIQRMGISSQKHELEREETPQNEDEQYVKELK